MMTANHLADDLDDLSDFLGQEDQVRVDSIHERLGQMQSLPDNYRDVITLSREVGALYQDLLDDIGEREKFAEQP